MGLRLVLRTMPFYEDKKNPKKCSICGSDSFRWLDDKEREQTIFIIQPMRSFDIKTGLGEPATNNFIPSHVYVCSNKKCNHVDFYVEKIPVRDITR